MQAFWKCWCWGGCPLPKQGLWEGSREMGKAFSCFTEVAPCGSRPPGLAMDVAPACLPACLPLLTFADLPERT